jgi:hypothetical protein
LTTLAYEGQVVIKATSKMSVFRRSWPFLSQNGCH